MTFAYSYAPAMWWFRVFGVGVAAKNLSVHPLLFSERNGCTRHVIILGWSFKFLGRHR